MKQAIVTHTERDTELIFRSFRNSARAARNEVAQQVVAIERDGGAFEDVRELVAGACGRRVLEDGDLEAGIWTAGQVQGLIHDIPTCAALVERIVGEAEDRIAGRLAGLVATAHTA